MKAYDVEGRELAVGDQVYYARKQAHHANGELVKCTITDIKLEKNRYGSESICVRMNRYKSLEPSRQILKL